MTTLAPPKLLRGFLVFKGYSGYVTDKTSPVFGKAMSWNYDIKVYPSTTSYPGIRNDYQYNALDISVGDWISSSVGGFAVQITAISPGATSTSINVTVEDIGNYNALGDPTGNGNGAPFPGSCFIFEVNDNNKPILVPEFAGTFAATYGVDLISRFEYIYGSGNDNTVTLSNITINWSTKFNVTPNNPIYFTLPTGVDFFISSMTLSDPMTVECHQTNSYNDTNPYKFIGILDQLTDDGTFVTDGKKYYGPRYQFLQNTQDRNSGVSYWKLTYTGSMVKPLSIVFKFSTFGNLNDSTIVYDNS